MKVKTYILLFKLDLYKLDKLEKFVRKRTRKQPPLPPVGHIKFDKDQQTLSRVILV